MHYVQLKTSFPWQLQKTQNKSATTGEKMNVFVVVIIVGITE